MKPEESFEAYSLGDHFASAVLGTTLHFDQKPRLVYSVNQMIRIFIMRELHLPYEAEAKAMELVSMTINQLGDDAPIFVTNVDSKPTPKPVDEPTA